MARTEIAGREARKRKRVPASPMGAKGAQPIATPFSSEAVEASALSPRYLKAQRWFQRKSSEIASVRISERAPLAGPYSLSFVDVRFAEGDAERYFVPLAEGGGVCEEATHDHAFLGAFVAKLVSGSTLPASQGEFSFEPLGGGPSAEGEISFEFANAGSTNTIVFCSVKGRRRYVLKMFRRLQADVSPEVELCRHLTADGLFPHSPKVRGVIEYEGRDGKGHSAAILFDYVDNIGSGWDWTVSWLNDFVERKVAKGGLLPGPELDLPLEAYCHHASELGAILADLHLALSNGRDERFSPQRVTARDLAGWKEGWMAQMARAFSLLEKVRGQNREAEALLGKREAIREVLEAGEGLLAEIGFKVRQHADFHLGQILFDGRSFSIIDFEGEPIKPQAERTLFFPPLKDVAGMIRSFNYASHTALFNAQRRLGDDPALQERVRAACGRWEQRTRGAFLGGYYGRLSARGAPFLPLGSKPLLDEALSLLVIEKALYELEYEINNRPEWVAIPIGGINELIEGDHESRFLYQ